MPEKDITPLAWKIELLLMDVDGVLTDGKLLLIPMPDGSVVEAKAFNVNDGAALAMARRAGLRMGIISGRSSAALTRRAEELKVDFFYHGLGRTKTSALDGDFRERRNCRKTACVMSATTCRICRSLPRRTSHRCFQCVAGGRRARRICDASSPVARAQSAKSSN